MPLSKKRKKERKGKPRDRQAAPSAPATPTESGTGGGLLTRMRGGLQSVAGTGARKRESPLSKIVTWAIVLLAAYFVARRFGIVP